MILEDDIFGLEAERKIVDSGVREVFTPHRPIQSIELFGGRRAEVNRIIENMNTPGQHILLFGDRGVGKSSLANISLKILCDKFGRELVIKRCDASDTFSSIVHNILLKVGVNCQVKSMSSKKAAALPKGLFSYEHISETSGNNELSMSPSWVAEKIQSVNGFLMIDEFDAILHDSDKHKIAELIKHLSDFDSKLKVMIVGIAETSSELMAGHPSVQRCLKEIKLRRMKSTELIEILASGGSRLGISFNKESTNRIVRVSSGFAHFTHLLALKSAEKAIANDNKEITRSDVIEATSRAIEDSEGSLKKLYFDSILSLKEGYQEILFAAASCSKEFFTSRELREAYLKYSNKEISQGTLNNYLGKIVSNKSDRIIRRVQKGIYCFSDPRMASFIKIAQTAPDLRDFVS